MKRNSTSTQQGFTLIEVLLVVLLIGVVSGIVLLAASPNDASRVVANEAERLADALSLASEEAVNNNQQIGLLFDEKSYYFLTLDEDEQKWLVSNEVAFAQHELAPVVSLHLAKDDTQKVMALDKDPKDTQQALTPQVLFLSSGESSSVVLELVSEDGSQQKIVVDDLGTVTLNPDEQSNEK
ncbi:MAG: type II secretion system minor pseudopilin GspH [Moraxellaceae bacterium]|nr:type II secretion system minor pseudopilin GspH [Pseudomonadales bacterium]MCP5175621.1 type II secretion system minor pseudopilin GspH [Moraxellaceae bacterium]MCP5177779.1 type II secretion system minor pseudopilin GspH [Moraxellaceae bacterium]HQV23891.1 type II secretion system minor pseudopilin GspH [Agitococcus sp.]